MWILIDDIRNLGCDVTCRTGEDGLRAIFAKPNKFDVLCIDHDLGEGMNGYEVIQELARHAVLPPRVQIVSSNPVGVQNIANVLKDEGYVTKDGRNFSRGRFTA
jgi:CheY-like chemotaxis protein